MTSQRDAAEAQAQARAMWLANYHQGRELTGKELGAEFGKSERWGRDRIAEAKMENGITTRPSSPRRPGTGAGAVLPPAAPALRPVNGTTATLPLRIERYTARVPDGNGTATETDATATAVVEAAAEDTATAEEATANETAAAVEPGGTTSAADDTAATPDDTATATATATEPDGTDSNGTATPPSDTAADDTATEPADTTTPAPTSHNATRRRTRDPQRTITAASVAIVAIVAAAVSYTHVQHVAAAAGEGWRSWLLPLSVDGLLVAAGLSILSSRRRGKKPTKTAVASLVLGTLASLAANVAAAGPSIIERVVAAWPPIAFGLAFELLMQTDGSHGNDDNDDDSPPAA